MSAVETAQAIILIRALPQTRINAPILVLNEDQERWAEKASAFLGQHVHFGSDKIVVLTSDVPDEYETAVLDVAARHHFEGLSSQFTVAERSAEWGRNFLLTIRRSPRWASTAGEPLTGGPAFIVAAGPSLDKNGHLLREAQKRGPIICTNTSIGACLHHGVIPDVVVCCESKDLRDHLLPLRGTDATVLIDAIAGDDNWRACDDPVAIIHHDTKLIPHAIALGVQPFNYNQSAACAATSVAIAWGASPIVLIGQDLAYTDGKCYAEGTPFADLRAVIDDGRISVSGSSKVVNPQMAIWRQRWGGGPDRIATSTMFDAVADWFEKAAERHEIVNATEGGVRISGTLDRRLDTLLAVMRERPRIPSLPTERRDTTELRRRMVAEAEAYLRQPTASVPPALSVLHLWAVPAVLATRDKSDRERQRAMVDALVRGCTEICEVLG